MAQKPGAAHVLIVFGFMPIYGFKIEETRGCGFLGSILTVICYCTTLGQTRLQVRGTLVGVGLVLVLGPLAGFTLLLGFIFLGIGSWHADRLPRWTAAPWVIGSAFIVPGYPLAALSASKHATIIGGVILGSGLVGAAVTRWRGGASP